MTVALGGHVAQGRRTSHCVVRGPVFLRVQLFSTADRISKWVKDFREHGNVATKTPTRRPSVGSSENVKRVRASVEESPRRSTRRRAQALGISRRNVQTIPNKRF